MCKDCEAILLVEIFITDEKKKKKIHYCKTNPFLDRQQSNDKNYLNGILGWLGDSSRREKTKISYPPPAPRRKKKIY